MLKKPKLPASRCKAFLIASSMISSAAISGCGSVPVDSGCKSFAPITWSKQDTVPTQRQEVSAPPAAPAPEPRQVTLRRAKQNNQRKIASASDLLYRYTARQTSVAPLTAAQPQQAQLPQAPAPWQPQAEQAHRAAEEAWRFG